MTQTDHVECSIMYLVVIVISLAVIKATGPVVMWPVHNRWRICSSSKFL